jgi:hypothetical protein
MQCRRTTRKQVIIMEFEETNHQEVAEPDQAGSRAACVGLNQGLKTGMVGCITPAELEELLTEAGFERLRRAVKTGDPFSHLLGSGAFEVVTYDPRKVLEYESGTDYLQESEGPGEEMRGSAKVSGNRTNVRDVTPSREKSGKKDRIVLGMGVLDNSRRQPVPPGSTLSTVAGAREPAEWTGKPEPAGSTGTLQPAGTARTEQPADPDTEQDDTQLDLIFALCERQERVSERLNRKVERLDQKLTARFDKKFELMDRKLVVLENRKVRE